jgi:hypothetical protein
MEKKDLILAIKNAFIGERNQGLGAVLFNEKNRQNSFHNANEFEPLEFKKYLSTYISENPSFLVIVVDNGTELRIMKISRIEAARLAASSGLVESYELLI